MGRLLAAALLISLCAPLSADEGAAPAPVPRLQGSGRGRFEEKPGDSLFPGRKRPVFVAGVRAWMADSSVDTRIAYQIPRDQVNGFAGLFYGFTEERGASGTIALFTAEFAPLEWLSLEAEYGSDRKGSHRSPGTYDDRYWIHSPGADTLVRTDNNATWHNPEHKDELVYSGHETAWREWASGNLYFRVLDAAMTVGDEAQIRGVGDLAFGYEQFRQESHVTDLSVTMNTGMMYANPDGSRIPVGPIPGFDATHTAVWRGPHVGARQTVELPGNVRLTGLALWSPFMQYRADGAGNTTLATDFITQSPNFHDTAGGTAIHFELGGAWRWSVFDFWAGYRRLYFYSSTGKRTYVAVGGATVEKDFDTTTTEVSGFLGGVSVHF